MKKYIKPNCKYAELESTELLAASEVGISEQSIDSEDQILTKEFKFSSKSLWDNEW